MQEIEMRMLRLSVSKRIIEGSLQIPDIQDIE